MEKTTHSRADVVICGAGIAGVAAAYYLATQQEITDIIVIDRLPPLSLTSAKSGENYRNWWPNPVMVQFMNRSIDLMDELSRATGNLFNMERRGYAYVSADPHFAGRIEHYLHPYSGLNDIRIHDRWDDDSTTSYIFSPGNDYDNLMRGADILLDRDTIQHAFPHLAHNVQAVIHARRCGAISAHQLGMHLLTSAKQLGVRELRGEVVAVERDQRGVAAVEVTTPSGPMRIETRGFINAAGPFMAPIAAMVDVELPVFSIFQQKIAFQDSRGVVPRDAPFTIFMDTQHVDWGDEERDFFATDPELRWMLDEFPGGVHVKPEGSSDSNWVKLGWAYNRAAETPRWDRAGAPEFPDIMLHGASRMIPGLQQYVGKLSNSFVHYGGYYTKTRENMPLIGPLEIDGATVPGAYMIGALSGFGTMAACAAGELIAAWVGGSEQPAYADPLSLARYRQDRSPYWDEAAGQGEL